MYLLIFESIGTSELILIGLVALIIFGPRKLPEMMNKFGKIMAEFKRSTNEFKQSWEKEVNFENIEKEETEKRELLENKKENSIGRESFPLENEIIVPEIKEIKGDDFERVFSKENGAKIEDSDEKKEVFVNETPNDIANKRDWL